MTLTKKELSALLDIAQVEVEDKYRGKIKGDEYFKRGMLLGCIEMKRKVFDRLINLTKEGE